MTRPYKSMEKKTTVPGGDTFPYKMETRETSSFCGAFLWHVLDAFSFFIIIFLRVIHDGKKF